MISHVLDGLSMGGYGFYVWGSVGSTLVAMLGYYFYANHSEKKTIKIINQQNNRQKMRQQRYASNQKKTSD